MKIQHWGLIGSLSIIIFAAWSPELALAARDLTSAAQSAVSTTTTVAKAASVLGIICGALIYQIPGAAMFARGTIVGGLIGAGLSFGGTSIIGFFQSILGG